MATKKELLDLEIAKAVGAGRLAMVETVDFNNPNRPKTCLEVDFPILPVNQVAIIEGNSGKPIYQMSKWWARRRSSVFRSVLIAAATKAPENPYQAAKAVWDNYYANHQKKGAFKHLKVVDIFMGGGTTLVEGSRLGMQMVGNDLNPVAWFVVKQELADVKLEEVHALLADIEAEVKPQIMPFYCCDGPNGEKGEWKHLGTQKTMGEDFDPLGIRPEERKNYRYSGPEIIYSFWVKHGPCQMTRCGHLTPILSTTVMAFKSITVKYWNHTCRKCSNSFHIEKNSARMAPDAPIYVAPGEHPHSALDPKRGARCPHCGFTEMVRLDKGKNKKVQLSLLVHPQWLEGIGSYEMDRPKPNSSQDDLPSRAQWERQRFENMRLLEVRGELPETVTCPETRITFKTGIGSGTVPKKSNFECGKCGTVQDVLKTIHASGVAAPAAQYAIHGLSENLKKSGNPYGGRFFALANPEAMIAAENEWNERSKGDLSSYWPNTPVQIGLETTVRTPLLRYGYKTWDSFFNARQLLVHALLLKAIDTIPGHRQEVREFVLAAFQQYIRNNNMFCIWDITRDTVGPFLSKNNLQPPNRPVENSVFGPLGRGNWTSCIEGIIESLQWREDPYEFVATQNLPASLSEELGAAKSAKVSTGDPVPSNVDISCQSSTDLSNLNNSDFDLVVTDPPFGDIMQYSELSGIFYAWLRLVFKNRYSQFEPEQPPSALEAVENTSRHGKDSAAFYSRLLTACWAEAHRVLRPGGILAFTFHHDKDGPWVAVLESLFNAGFYLEATYPVRSDETKGEGGVPGTFGAQKVEYDVIHVCRKRTEDPQPVSWGKMRRQVLQDVRGLRAMLESHLKAGLPEADLKVISRGKALEYFSRHYGKVFVDEDRTMTVKDALIGINQLLDEDANQAQQPPPVNAEPITRQFLRIFDSKFEVPRDQMQKFLRGSGMTPDEFEQRNWCNEKNKIFTATDPLEFARDWQGRHKRRLVFDLDQALVLIGACFENSGINATDTLRNETFKPHVALKGLLDWFEKNGASQTIRNAASRGLSIYNNWAASNKPQTQYPSLFSDEELA